MVNCLHRHCRLPYCVEINPFWGRIECAYRLRLLRLLEPSPWQDAPLGLKRVSKGPPAHKALRANKDHRDLKVQRAKVLRGRKDLKEQTASKVRRDHRELKANKGLPGLKGNKDRQAQRASQALRALKGSEAKRASKELRAPLVKRVLQAPPGQRPFTCFGKIPVTPIAVATSNAVPGKSLLL